MNVWSSKFEVGTNVVETRSTMGDSLGSWGNKAIITLPRWTVPSASQILRAQRISERFLGVHTTHGVGAK